MAKKQVGKQTIRFLHPPVIQGAASVVGKKEGEGPYGEWFDCIEKDPKMGGDSWEEAEGKFQEKAAKLAIEHAGLQQKEIRYIVAGDLLGQLMASSFGLLSLQIPLFGVYGACSTMGESMGIATMIVEGGFADHVLALTSSHFASAEKQFRFPLGYGNQRPKASTWTATGSGAVVISKSVLEEEKESHKIGQNYSKEALKEKGKVHIEGITTGKVIDFGIKDSMNMGACMAPPAGNIEQ